MFTISEKKKLRNGGFVDVNGKRYGLCGRCNFVVRVNKPILGGLHICDCKHVWEYYEGTLIRNCYKCGINVNDNNEEVQWTN